MRLLYDFVSYLTRARSHTPVLVAPTNTLVLNRHSSASGMDTYEGR